MEITRLDAGYTLRYKRCGNWLTEAFTTRKEAIGRTDSLLKEAEDN